MSKHILDDWTGGIPFAPCPKCLQADALQYEEMAYGRERVENLNVCRCEWCGARFEVEHDYSFEGERVVDCCTPGRRIA